MSVEQMTGTSNPTYDLVSVIYHSLQGAETTEQYVRDAESSGDKELARFFRDEQDRYRQCAQKAEQLLAERLKR